MMDEPQKVERLSSVLLSPWSVSKFILSTIILDIRLEVSKNQILLKKRFPQFPNFNMSRNASGTPFLAIFQ